MDFRFLELILFGIEAASDGFRSYSGSMQQPSQQSCKVDCAVASDPKSSSDLYGEVWI